MISLEEVTAAAMKVLEANSFGPSAFDELDAEEAAEQAMDATRENRDWLILDERFDGADDWQMISETDGVRDMRKPAGSNRVGRSHVSHMVFHHAAQVELSDGRFLTFVARA